MESIGNPWLWGGFAVVVIVALFADLVLMKHGGPHKVTFKEAALWSVGWVVLALLFALGLWWYEGQVNGPEIANEVTMKFLTGYLMEKALSVDNIFVFLMLFNYFAVPDVQRQRVLMLGVLGAIVLRAVMIFIGVAVVSRYEWVLYLFGAFLLFSGIKMWTASGEEPDMDKNPVLRWVTNRLPFVRRYYGTALWIGQGSRRKFTPLFIVLVMIAVTDVIFAVDSIPAIFGITTDLFIVLTSNVFAVLGLRALFFMLAGAADRFHLLSHGLALVLVFIGIKMLLMYFFHIPVFISLGVVAVIITGSIVLSLLMPKEEKPAA